MSEIKRFNHGVCEYPGGTFSEMNQEADGDYVLFSDHEAEVARLRAELQNAAKAALDAVALSCEKEREADALRAEAEGLRKTLGEVTQCLADTVNEVGGWAVEEVIEAGMEAAMGASA